MSMIDPIGLLRFKNSISATANQQKTLYSHVRALRNRRIKKPPSDFAPVMIRNGACR